MEFLYHILHDLCDAHERNPASPHVPLSDKDSSPGPKPNKYQNQWYRDWSSPSQVTKDNSRTPRTVSSSYAPNGKQHGDWRIESSPMPLLSRSPLCCGKMASVGIYGSLFALAAAPPGPLLLAIPFCILAGRVLDQQMRPGLAQHAGMLVCGIVDFVEKLAIGRIVFWGLYPVAGHHAGESNANAGRSIEPAGPWGARELVAEVRGKVVAVFCEEIVRGAEEVVRGIAERGVNFFLRGEGEAVEDLASKGAARGLCLGLCPVDTRHSAPVVAAVCVFATVDDDAGVEQRGPKCPQDGGYATGLDVQECEQRQAGLFLGYTTELSPEEGHRRVW